MTLWDILEPVARVITGKPAVPKARPALRRPADREREGPSRHAGAEAGGRVTSIAKGLELVPRAMPRGGPAEGAVPAVETMEERYERVTREMLAKYGIRVRRWRSSMSGMAWELRYNDGSKKRLIESPQPRGPMSMAIFLHEVGHHAIGFDRYKPRCLEEYHAWAWSLAAMEAHGLNITDAVRHRMAESLWYAVAKAKRRGLRVLPPELEGYQVRPPRRKRGRAVER